MFALLMVSKLKGSKEPSLSVMIKHMRERDVCAVVFSPNGKYIAVGGRDSKVVLLHSSTLEVVEVCKRDDDVNAVAFSRNGKYFAVGGSDRKLAILNTSTWEVMKEYERGGDVLAVSFDPHSEIVAVGGDDCKIETLDTSVGIVYEYENDAPITKIALSPNGETLTISGDDKKIRMLDILTGKVYERKTDNNVTRIAYSPNSECIAFNDGKKIIIMSSLTKKVLFDHELDGDIYAINYSPDGKSLAVGGVNKVQILDTSSYVINARELEGVGAVLAIAHSSDNALIAVGGGGNKVVILDASTFDVKKELPQEYNVFAIEFSPDNKNIVVGGNNKKVIVYETTTYAAVGEYKQGNGVRDITYTPDSKYITVETTGGNKTLVLLDPKNDLKQLGCPILVPEVYQETNQAPSADSYHIAVAYGKSCAIIDLHQHSYTPTDLLLRTENDDEVIDFMKTHPAPAFARKEILLAAMKNDRLDIVLNFLQNDPSLAIQKDYVDEETNGVLSFLYGRNLLKQLNGIADCGLFERCTSPNQLDEMLEILRKLAITQNKTSLVNLLSSGEKDMMEGFVNMGETYALKPSTNWRWVPSLFKCVEEDDKLPHALEPSKNWRWVPSFFNWVEEYYKEPLTSELAPRSSSAPPDREITWEDLKYDNDARVRVKVLRVLLPDLASFDSINSLLQMKENDAFKNRALIASIDANWESWAKKIFHFQALLYSVWLVCFTMFCLITKDEIQPDHWGIHVLTAIMVCCVLHFMSYESRQLKFLGIFKYVMDPWNTWEWISKVTAISTIILTYSVSSSLRVIAITSATSLLLAWFRIFYFMLGFESCAWIVSTLFVIMMSMGSFLFVMGLIVFTFALSFHALYEGRGVDSYDVDSNYYVPPAFESIGSAIETTIFAGIYGDFDRQFVDELYSSTYALILLHAMLFIILVISLNTLIAFISDIYADIGSELGGKKRQRARIIYDMYGCLTERKRKKIEAKHRWTSLVIPVASLEVHASKVAEVNFAKATKEDTKKLMMINKAIYKEIDGIKEGMNENKENNDGMKATKEDMKALKKDIDEMKEGMEGMKESNNGIKDEMEGMKESNNGIKDGIKGMEESNNGMKEDINGMKTDINGIKESIDAMMKLMKGAKKEENE